MVIKNKAYLKSNFNIWNFVGILNIGPQILNQNQNPIQYLVGSQRNTLCQRSFKGSLWFFVGFLPEFRKMPFGLSGLIIFALNNTIAAWLFPVVISRIRVDASCKFVLVLPSLSWTFFIQSNQLSITFEGVQSWWQWKKESSCMTMAGKRKREVISHQP